MATILYAWELGGGLGHILRSLPLARKLAARGHRVVAALRELRHAEHAFGAADIQALSENRLRGGGQSPFVPKTVEAMAPAQKGTVPDGSRSTLTPALSQREREKFDIQYLPAPHLAWRIPDPIEPVRTYADLLHNVGFAHVEDLRILTRAWHTLFALVRPDVILCDHSPTALLAASLDGIPCASIGTGFCCPPAGEMLPNLRPWLKDKEPAPKGTVPVCSADHRGDGARAKGDSPRPHPGPLPEGEGEERVLANINEVRIANGKPAWERLSELYSSVAETFLTTFAELDHFAVERLAPVGVQPLGCAMPAEAGTPTGRYRGVWESDQGAAFEWPSGKGPKVFLYTHRFPARDWLLDHLRHRGLPTVAYTHDLSREAAEKLAGPTLHIASAPLDIAQAAAECDVAILNSGHNSAAQFLLAGKPLLLLPISLEQGLLMRRLVEQGLAVSAPPDRPAAIQAALDDLLSNKRCREAARAFAARYASYDPGAAQDMIVARIAAHAGG